jgi:hypothetical protein
MGEICLGLFVKSKGEIMDWLKLMSAAGIGAIIIKLIDILWLEKSKRNYEHRKWIKEQRLKAYSQLITELSSKKIWDLSLRGSEDFVNISDALLLASPNVAAQIDIFYQESKVSLKKFVGNRGLALDHGDDSMFEDCYEVMNSEYRLFQDKKAKLISELRREILEDK